MGLLDFSKKKKGTCDCNSKIDSQPLKDSKYIVLGACCKKSSESFENTKIALKEMGIEEQVINLGSPEDIAKYGVLQTPALVINNKVVSYGKLLKVEDVKKIIADENN